MAPISLQLASVSGQSLIALVLSCFVLGLVHAGWTMAEKRWFPIAEAGDH